MTLSLQVVLYGLVAGAGIAIGAMSFTVVYSTTKHFHVAQAAVVTAGSFAGVLVVDKIPGGWPLAIVVATVVCALVAFVVHVVVYEPLGRAARPLEIFIGSLGAMIVIQNALAIVFGVQPRLASIDWLSRRHQLSSGFGITNNQVLTIALAVLVWGGLKAYLTRTAGGHEIQATADDPLSAAIIGIDVKTVYRKTYLLASAALGPLTFIVITGPGAEPYGGTKVFILAAIAAFMGGRGSVTGALLAGLVFGLVESISVLVLSAEWQTTVALGVFIVILMVRPQGLLRIEREAGV